MLMVNKYQAIGFLGGLVGTGSIGFLLTLITGGGLIILGDKQKFDDAGWGVVAGAGVSLAVALAIATWIVMNQPGTDLAVQAEAFLSKHGVNPTVAT